MSKKAPLTGLLHEELEPRLLFSAGAEAVLLDIGLPDDEAAIVETITEAEIEVLQLEVIQQDTDSTLPAKEVVFIDENVPDYDELMADLAGKNNIDIYILDDSLDGIEQISAVLENYQNLDAIHLISHGDEQGLYLGNGSLDNSNIDAYSASIGGWQTALSEQADLLIYGCDVAAGEQGLALLDKLNILTGTDIAASDDLTGHSSLGGDWDLEYNAGEIETSLAFTDQLQQDWHGILPPNNAPVNSVPGAQTTTEGVALTFSSGNANLISISDPDADIPDVTLTVTNGTVTLSQTTGLTITAGADGSNTVTINGAIADINAALDGMVYTPTASWTGTETLTIYTYDNGFGGGGALSDTDIVSIAVNANSAPVLDNSGAPSLTTITEDDTTNAGDTVSAIIGTSITDADAGAVEGIAITGLNSSNGTWQYQIDGGAWADVGTVSTSTALLLKDTDSLRFIPDTINADTASISFSAWDQTDGTAGSKVDASTTGGTSAFSTASETATISVSAVNDAPTAGANTVATNEDTPLVFAAADFNFSDIDGDSLNSVKITSLESTGTLQWYDGGTWQDVSLNQVISKADIDAGNFRFVPVTNASGTSYDSFAFSVNDGTSDSGSSYTMTVDVNAVNDTPTAAINTVTTNEDTSYTFSSADFNYYDIDGDPMASVKITSLETSGSLKWYDGVSWQDVTLNQVISKTDIDAGYLMFTPAANANGTAYDAFSFSVNDGAVDSTATFTMTVDVNAVNDSPSLSNLSGDVLAYTEGDGAIVLDQATPVSLSDIDSSNFDTGTLTISIPTGNDATEDALSINNQGTGAGQIGISCSDVTYEGTIIGSFTGGSSGSDLVITFNVNATPTAVQSLIQNITYENTDTTGAVAGTRIVRFVLTDGDGGSTGNHDVTVNVSCNNNPPSITSLTSDTLAYTEGDGAVVIEQGSDIIVSDGGEGEDFSSGNLTVNFSVNGVSTEDVLSINNQGSGAGQIGFDGTNVSYEGGLIGTVTGGSGGTDLVITFTNTPNETAIAALLENISYENTNTDAPSTASRTVSFILTNASNSSYTDTAMIDVTAINDAPTNTLQNSTASANEDTSIVFNAANSNLLSVADVDATSVQVTLSVSNGTLSLNGTTGLSFSTGDGTADASMVFYGSKADINAALDGLTYTSNTNWNGSDTLSMTTSDLGASGSGGTLTDTDTVAISIAPVNDAPTASHNTVIATEDTPYTFSSTDFNFSDIDGDSMASIEITSLESVGSLQLNGVDVTLNQVISKADIDAGKLVFTPVTGASGTGYDSYTFTVNDGTTDSVSAYTITIDVNPTNDAPVISGSPTTTITPGESYSFIPTANDVDGDSLTFSISNLPSWASFDTSTGEISGTPDDSHAGTYSNIIISVSDGTVISTLPAFDITVESQYAPISYTPPDIPAPDIEPDTTLEAELPVEAEAEVESSTEPEFSEESNVDVELDADENGKTSVLLKHGSQELLQALTANQTGSTTVDVISNQDQVNEEHTLIESVSPWQLDSGTLNLDLQKALDELNEQLGSDGSAEQSNNQVIVTTAAGLTIGLTAGFVTWALQGSSLLTALLTTLPAWNTFDPLPVLNAKRDKKEASIDTEESDGVDSVFADFQSGTDK